MDSIVCGRVRLIHVHSASGPNGLTSLRHAHARKAVKSLKRKLPLRNLLNPFSEISIPLRTCPPPLLDDQRRGRPRNEHQTTWFHVGYLGGRMGRKGLQGYANATQKMRLMGWLRVERCWGKRGAEHSKGG